MNIILESMVNSLIENYELSPINLETDFELFCNYTILSKEYNNSLDLDNLLNVCVDSAREKFGSTNSIISKPGTMGIDGIAIVINGLLIHTSDQVDELININKKLDVSFIFIQAKSGEGFDSGEISKMGLSVLDFFSDSSKLDKSENAYQYYLLKNYIFKKAIHFIKNPMCKLFFVTSGKWSHDKNIKTTLIIHQKQIMNLNIFSSVDFIPYGFDEIIREFRKLEKSNEVEISLKDNFPLEKIIGIDKAYFGIISFREFKKLIIDENNNLNNIFYDNVRDFLGENTSVNSEINKTLTGDNAELFTVLNNGITIISSDIKQTGKSFVLKDFQIVNGCQTSNILFRNSTNETIQNICIPLKLIATEDELVKGKIIIATNNQTSVTRSQLLAMTEFQKRLEEYYLSYAEGFLRYERRNKQYQGDQLIKKSRILSIDNQIKSFGSMFLLIPDEVTSYLGRTHNNYISIEKPKIFNNDHLPISYYTSGLAYFKIMHMFSKGKIDPSYRKIKFFILTIFSLLVLPKNLLPELIKTNTENKITNKIPKTLSNKNIQKICNDIIDILNDDQRLFWFINLSLKIIDASGLDITDKEILKKKRTTEIFIESALNFIENNPAN